MNSSHLSKYIYIRQTPTWLVRSVYIFGIISWLLVVYGYSSLMTSDPFYWWLFSPILLFFTLYYLNSYIINLYYKQFNVVRHRRHMKEFWESFTTLPTVDVFLPICGEETAVLRQTFRAVFNLQYPLLHVFVLDDKGLAEHKELTKEFAFTYLSRDDKGFNKKAGNLKYGYERSHGDYVAIFDADFAPHPDFVKHLLPYMSDPRVAIVQSPQYFQTDKAVHDRSALEYGAAQVQEDFYRFIQVARSRLGAPICCGSNAIYRRAALDTIGGTTQIEHSEDMHTGFDLTNRGWRVQYVPIVLAVGICPTNIHQYFHQQHRWCSGSLSLMFDKKFWFSSHLTMGQKMCFISGFMYYMSYPLTIVISFQAFITLFRHSTEVTLANSLPFIPCFLFSFVVMPLFRISRPRIGNFIARTANSYAYCHAVVTAFIKNSVDWQPTNVKKMKISKAFRDLVTFNALYLVAYVAFIGIAIHINQFHIMNPSNFLVLFWMLFNLCGSVMILYIFYLVFDSDKIEESSVKKHPMAALTLWRLKTAGVYTLCIISVLVFTIQYGLL